MISCFDLATCSVVRAFDEAIAVGWLLHWTLNVDDAVSTAVDHRMNAIHPYFQLLNAATLERAHAQRLLVNVWTVNSPLDLRAMMDLGVDGLITDDPATALRLAHEPRPDEGPRPMA